MTTETTPLPLPPRSLAVIAREVRRDWLRPSPYARPYISAMLELNTMNDQWGCDSAKSVVLYFLSNAAAWKGETARRVKAELNAMVKGA